jgi:hypothetical protein
MTNLKIISTFTLSFFIISCDKDEENTPNSRIESKRKNNLLF